MKNIWIIAPFAGIAKTKYRNRFQYLAKMLVNNNYNVTLFTSDFSHSEKDHVEKNDFENYPFDIELVHEPGYSNNVSLKRALSHVNYSFNLKKAINKYNVPDIIYAAYPTMSAAFVAGKYANNNNIPFVIDVQDTWPESISAAIDTDKLLVKTVMWPFTKFADHIYSMADLVLGVSETYAQRANVKNSKAKDYVSVYIGAELDTFDSVAINSFNIKKPNNEIWVTYIGTLSYSYDIDTAIEAFSKLDRDGNLKLNILGTGPDEDRLKKLAKNLRVYNKNVFFHGYLEYEKMVAYLKESDLALNAISSSSKGTITNKFGDYVSAGLPILNSCQEKEVLYLIRSKGLGINYTPGDPDSLKDAIEEILSDKNKLIKYGKNSREFAEEYFDRKNSYQIILDKLEELL